ncbi:MAG: urease accessory protein [Candidatus Azotimanducaceae bacterium]|jgi:urease accessory protein
MRIECFEKIDHLHEQPWSDTISLNFSHRSRSRGKAATAKGRELAWFLERGESLHHGNALKDAQGRLYLVQAAPEPVSVVTADSVQLLMRVAYHLGNRHLSLQVLPDRLMFQPDHVLDDMVTGLGANVTRDAVAFQPEDGAYHGQGHGHDHGHDHE